MNPEAIVSRGPVPSYFELRTGARTKTRYKVFQPYHLTVFRELMSETWHDLPELDVKEILPAVESAGVPSQPKQGKGKSKMPKLSEINNNDE